MNGAEPGIRFVAAVARHLAGSSHWYVVLLLSILAAGAFGSLMNTVMRGLHPHVLRLELARDRDMALLILRCWGEDGKKAARKGIWLDFLFLIAYGAGLLALAMIAGDIAGAANWWLARFAVPVAAIGLIAALLDALENGGMLLMLRPERTMSEWLPTATSFCARMKFTGVAISILYAPAVLLRAEAGVVLSAFGLAGSKGLALAGWTGTWALQLLLWVWKWLTAPAIL